MRFEQNQPEGPAWIGARLVAAMTAAVLASVLVAGCAVGPDYRAPDAQVPDRWCESATQGVSEGKSNVQQWWQVFNDPQLSSLIERASTGNLDLRLAVLRIREARAIRGIAAGALLPTLGDSASYQRAKASANGPGAIPRGISKGEAFASTVGRGVAGSALNGALGAAAPGATGLTLPLSNGLLGLLPTPSKLPETDEVNLLSTGFDASWEIDVFGGIRRNVESADANLQASVEDYRDTLVTLLAEVASTYVEIRTLQSEIVATQDNIKLQRETLGLTERRLALELATELDVEQAQTNLATTESRLPELESSLAISVYRLSVLLGLEPAALCKEFDSASPIPEAPGEVLVGVPADILRQRPDIRSAERRLAAQTAQIGVAAADLYPRFTLSGTFGFQSTDFNHILDERSITYGFGPSMRWNIFDGLRNLNRIAAQQAVTHQTYIVYQRTLLGALQEVENALVSYKREQVRRDALLRASKAAARSVKLAETLYSNGLVDFQNVLDAQRSLANLQNTLAQSRGQVAINLVSLYKAIGGGWSPEVNPQYEYMEAGPDATREPAEFFFSGGKTALPWTTAPAERDEEDR